MTSQQDKLKVLFLASTYSNAHGIAPYVYAQGESLKKSGVDVQYFQFKGFSLFKYMIGFFQLHSFLKNNDFDLIHAHYSYNGFLASFYPNIPFVVSFLGSDILLEHGFIRTKIEKNILERIFKRSSAVLCKTAEIRKKIPDNINVHVVPNGVDLKKFYPIDKDKARKQLSLNKTKKYVLFPANPLNKIKNYKLAEDAFDLLNDPDAELLTVFNKPQHELNLYYNASDVLLVASKHEGSINVVKEAMATNLPVVSVDVGDVRERIESVRNCYLLNRDKKKIAAKLKEIINKGERSDGREHIKNLDESVIASNIISIYNDVLKGGNDHEENMNHC
jgi:glycosyltransferase involved in cell wall biosynthesis